MLLSHLMLRRTDDCSTPGRPRTRKPLLTALAVALLIFPGIPGPTTVTAASRVGVRVTAPIPGRVTRIGTQTTVRWSISGFRQSGRAVVTRLRAPARSSTTCPSAASTAWRAVGRTTKGGTSLVVSSLRPGMCYRWRVKIRSTSGRDFRALSGIALVRQAATATPIPTPAPVPIGDCSGSLQSKIDAAASSSVVNLTGCIYTAGATVNKSLTLVGAAIRPTAGMPGISVTASDVTLDSLTITGPQSRTYNGGELGIRVNATPTNPVRRLTVRNSVVSNFGHGGIYLRHAANFVVTGNTVTDTVYAGIQVLSGATGTVRANVVRRVGVYGSAANSGNAYGIQVSYQSPSDPMSADIVVDGNTVETVQTWEAMDTHGGQRITFSNNIVRYSRRGVMITTGPNGLPATDCRVTGNQFLAPVTVNPGDQYAVSPVNSVNLTVTGNTMTGWGSGHDMMRTYQNTNLVYSGNLVTP
jgi:parallel beta-helix repeat protein